MNVRSSESKHCKSAEWIHVCRISCWHPTKKVSKNICLSNELYVKTKSIFISFDYFATCACARAHINGYNRCNFVTRFVRFNSGNIIELSSLLNNASNNPLPTLATNWEHVHCKHGTNVEWQSSLKQHPTLQRSETWKQRAYEWHKCPIEMLPCSMGVTFSRLLPACVPSSHWSGFALDNCYFYQHSSHVRELGGKQLQPRVV